MQKEIKRLLKQYGEHVLVRACACACAYACACAPRAGALAPVRTHAQVRRLAPTRDVCALTYQRTLAHTAFAQRISRKVRSRPNLALCAPAVGLCRWLRRVARVLRRRHWLRRRLARASGGGAHAAAAAAGVQAAGDEDWREEEEPGRSKLRTRRNDQDDGERERERGRRSGAFSRQRKAEGAMGEGIEGARSGRIGGEARKRGGWNSHNEWVLKKVGGMHKGEAGQVADGSGARRRRAKLLGNGLPGIDGGSRTRTASRPSFARRRTMMQCSPRAGGRGAPARARPRRACTRAAPTSADTRVRARACAC
eukprot:6190983-Pleurochrysis_carterae.AAC.1